MASKSNSIIDAANEYFDSLIKSRFIEMFDEYISNGKSTTIGKISELCTVGIANAATHAYQESGVVMFRNQNIKENELDDADLLYISEEFADHYSNKKLKENDILVLRTGYAGRACLVPKQYEGAQTFTTLILRLKKTDDVNPHYVCRYINSIYGQKYVNTYKVGSSQQNFGAKVLEKMPIVIPPIDLQNKYERFVKQVDKSKLDFQKLVSGFDELIKSRFIEMFGHINDFTDGIKTKAWSELLEIRNGRDYKGVSSTNQKYPVYGSGGVMTYVDEYLCPENTVIIGRKGSINNPILVREKFWNVDTAFGLIPDVTQINAVYLYWFCHFYDFNKHNKATTLPSLTKADLLKIRMKVPPIESQEAFSSFVKQVDKSKSEILEGVKKLKIQ